ncbi:MAG: SRPBCC domain-containing protein [Ferruginibacter sp.]
MDIIKFSILINAGKEKVWNSMLGDTTYRQWTKPFNETSYFEGNWEKDTEIRFLGTGKDGKAEGMYSRIKENIPHEFISIEHLGIISNGVVDTTSEEVKKWAPSFENYTFTETDGQTEVIVEMQISAEYKDAFEKMWPNALKELKTICES